MAKINLSKTSSKTPKGASAEKAKMISDTHFYRMQIAELQEKMYAQNKKSLLVVIQGMDAAGKGGAIKNTFKEANPMGCKVFPFKKPTEEEFAHDFLWRINKRTPQKGMIHIFDRSHYEDVLIQWVHKWIDEDRLKMRYKSINCFEELLIKDNNTTIIKFYLHVSKDEQLKRILERKEDPNKNWKYNPADLEEREHWDTYMEAYEGVIKNCSEAAPWNIIPSDSNWYKEYLVAKIVYDTMSKMELAYPTFQP
jgi:PPK2 family polyphosphate:nucleotide phosphotransferase